MFCTSRVHRTGSNAHLKYNEIQLHIRKKLSVRTVKDWKKYPQQNMESLSLKFQALFISQSGVRTDPAFERRGKDLYDLLISCSLRENQWPNILTTEGGERLADL